MTHTGLNKFSTRHHQKPAFMYFYPNFIIDILQYRYLFNNKKELGIFMNVSQNFLVSCLMRAALDTRSVGLIDTQAMDHMINILRSALLKISADNYFELSRYLVHGAAEYLIKNNYATIDMTPKGVYDKFNAFLQEGPKSWVEPLENKFFLLKWHNLHPLN